jgi:predicted pyridoxine 5'-phosphate oxidase superfamily flavin-nucleotide-binding protein
MGKLSEEMKKLVERQRLGFVATVCPDGTPNVSPKGTVSVLDDEHLIFADIRSPGTVANLRTNPNVEVNVVDHFVRKGYRFRARPRYWARALSLIATSSSSPSVGCLTRRNGFARS